jgi:predicted MFS family arabinose efflux permease
MITLITVGEMLAMPFMNSFWISRTQQNNRGQYAALYTMAWSAAQTLGPMGGAFVADQYGFATLWWLLGAICIITSFFFYRMLRYNT